MPAASVPRLSHVCRLVLYLPHVRPTPAPCLSRVRPTPAPCLSRVCCVCPTPLPRLPRPSHAYPACTPCLSRVRPTSVPRLPHVSPVSVHCLRHTSPCPTAPDRGHDWGPEETAPVREPGSHGDLVWCKVLRTCDCSAGRCVPSYFRVESKLRVFSRRPVRSSYTRSVQGFLMSLGAFREERPRKLVVFVEGAHEGILHLHPSK